MITSKELTKSQEAVRVIKPLKTSIKWVINKITFLEVFRGQDV